MRSGDMQHVNFTRGESGSSSTIGALAATGGDAGVAAPLRTRTLRVEVRPRRGPLSAAASTAALRSVPVRVPDLMLDADVSVLAGPEALPRLRPPPETCSEAVSAARTHMSSPPQDKLHTEHMGPTRPPAHTALWPSTSDSEMIAGTAPPLGGAP